MAMHRLRTIRHLPMVVQPEAFDAIFVGFGWPIQSWRDYRYHTYLVLPDTNSEHRSLATSVLKAHIAVAQQVFPVGTLGHALDSAARLPMWQAKLDYDHGTGHGVGHYLSVHEFPQRMQKAGTAVGLEAGMTLTVEPGFYRADEFGIRHENLCEVVCRGDGWLGLESMAYVPFNRRLIDTEMLTPAERAWVDTYHQEVRAGSAPYWLTTI